MTLRRRQTGGSRHRRGAAFFVLILAVVLVVVGAMMTLVRSEWSSAMRRSERFRVQAMHRAIDAVATTQPLSETTERYLLPIDAEKEEHIEVTITRSSDGNGNELIYTARWLRGNQLIDMLARTATDQPNDEVEENDDEP